MTTVLGDETTLNIFTDASLAVDGRISVSCAGALAVYKKDNKLCIFDKMYRITKNSTNNYGEATGVLLGVLLAAVHKDKFKTINLYCDSRITILGLREWFIKWGATAQDGVLYSSSGNEVANQSILLKIINTVVSNNIHINLYHQKGHVILSNRASIEHSQTVFSTSNGLKIDYDTAFTIASFNDVVDKESRSVLLNCIASKYDNHNDCVFDTDMTQVLDYMYSDKAFRSYLRNINFVK